MSFMKLHANGIDIHYEISGRGPCVMFAHSLGSDLSIWEAQKSALAARHTVLCHDLRGHGGTDAPAGACDFDLLAADAVALLDALGIERASFVGISLGGMIGQAVALAAPQRIERLVLASTASRYPPEARTAWAERIRQVEATGLEPLVGPTLERWFTAPYRAAHPEVMARIGGLIRATPVAGYVGCCHAIATLDFTARLKALAMPTLVLAGEQDQGTPPAMAREIAAAIPGARLEIIGNAAHLANIEQADAFTGFLAEFLG
ncbi:MAG: 3-oxoadipate enol-lactonase [Sulfurisoma sp.]|nr:3-oxoadipate enol-lactonase [Sulfurisoma sp.]